MSATVLVRFLLDTDTVIAAMKGHALLRAHLEQTPLSRLLLSPIVLGELSLGVEKSAYRDRNSERLSAIAAEIELAVLDAQTSRHYGRIRAELERAGTPIGNNDTWIAAQAVALGAVLVTGNVREFSRVAGLALENWLVA